MSTKRRGGCSTSSNSKQKSCKNSGKTGRLHGDINLEEGFSSFSDSGEDVWSKLGEEAISNLSGSVVSLASFNGDQKFTCTGLVVKHDLSGAKILTSASLMRAGSLMIDVRLPNGSVVGGWFIQCDLPYDAAVVNVRFSPGLQVACINRQIQFGSHSKVVAVGRCYDSGILLASSGILEDESGVSPGELMTSTCIINKSGIGGPLIDFEGNFVGMNLDANEKTLFIPMNTIFKDLVERVVLTAGIEEGSTSIPLFCASESSSGVAQGISKRKSQNKNQKSSKSSKRVSKEPELKFHVYHRNIRSLPHFRPLADDKFTAHFTERLKSRGYPLPEMLDGGMRLLETFEDDFAENIWGTLSQKLEFNISQSVVSLASFNKQKRLFACTGVLIGRRKSITRVLTSASLVRDSADANKIADELVIQVYLPNGQLAKGKLQHYNFQCNVAVVSIKGFNCRRTAKFDKLVQASACQKVIAIGRVFETGKLLATSGELVEKRNNLSCTDLKDSTCIISKAGIGGPLIDFDGNFIGMNFYDKGQTPYLPGDKILEVLRQFDEKRVLSDEAICCPRWPVPEPHWHYPSTVYYVFHSYRRKL